MVNTIQACVTTILTILVVSAAATDPPATSIPTYTVTTILHEPYTMLNPKSTDSSTKYIGIVKDILDRISHILNVNFKFVHVGDNAFGRQINDSGNWTGMIGELLRKEADIAASALTVSAERAKKVHFSQMFTDTGLSILLKKPQKHAQSHNSASLPFCPFTVGIWASIIVAYIIVSLVLYVISRMNPEERAADRGEDHITICTAFFVTLSMLSLQGFRLTPTSLAGRTLVCFWWMFALVTVVMYTSSLTSMLFLKFPDVEDPLPFYTFEQMTKQTKIEYGTLMSGSTRHYFKTFPGATEKVINQYWNNRHDLLVSSIEEGVARVRNSNGDYAFVMESEMSYYLVAQTCDLAVTAGGENRAERSYAFACRPDIDICRQLDHAIIQMKENGELRPIMDKWISGPCGRYVDLSSPLHYVPPTMDAYMDVKHMDMTRFTVPLVAMAFGVILSALLAVVEIYRSKARGISRGSRVPMPEDQFYCVIVVCCR
ncbi:glutamate receptor U1-like isoform X2 [Mizuhopecten yessoensis]|uniref:glutamate receptor U1-like isoform X2 n=1 Tax=Mizuhopecten yessoensis TaxID=6573 RepID=UPI000B45C18D|nr:glutamate receptor U1-like isoform X2 [Mizuhopecten yessoensis]